MSRHKIYDMSFASVYPHYVAKAERKGRTKAEVDEIIRWLTGYSDAGLAEQLDAETSFEAFFAQAPALTDARHLITGVICGDRKSTRLNSSHVAISYAVFCLKKKSRNHRQ